MPPESRRVYVDFDDVLCATARGFLDILRQEFGKTIEFEDIVDYDLGRSFDLDPADLERFFELAHEEEVLAGLEPLEGAFEAVSDWRDRGFAVEVVTGRPPNTRSASQAWLAAHEVAYAELIFVDKYGHAPGGISLDEIVERDYAWVVEDSFAMAEQLAIGGHRVHLLDRPWNQLVSRADAAILRCSGWDEVRLSVQD